MAVSYKDINELTQKSSVVGTEKLPISDTQYITPDQIAALGIIGDGVEEIVTLTNAEYQALTTKDPNTIYIVTDVDPGGGGGGGGSIDSIVMNGDAVTVTGGVADLGTVITQHQDISGKADKVSNSTNGNFAGLNASGNLTDSGHNHSDYQAALVSGTNIKTVNSTSLLGSGDVSVGTYSKPSGGIPATDLASAVQTSLGKADTALQSYTETDPVFSASAAHGISSTDINNWNAKQKAITVSTSEPTSSDGSDGDIWIVI